MNQPRVTFYESEHLVTHGTLLNQINMESYSKDSNGPIEKFSWGRFVIKGETHEKTDRSKTGKGKDIYTLIIGIGVEGRIDCPEQVKKEIRKNGISELMLLKTPDAWRKYNELYHQGRKVALLAHGTC